MKVKSESEVAQSCVSLTAAYQAPPSMGFSRQEYWSGVPLPSPKKSIAVSKNVHSSQVEKEMATHSSTLAWKIQWTEEHGRLQSIGLQRVRHD